VIAPSDDGGLDGSARIADGCECRCAQRAGSVLGGWEIQMRLWEKPRATDAHGPTCSRLVPRSAGGCRASRRWLFTAGLIGKGSLPRPRRHRGKRNANAAARFRQDLAAPDVGYGDVSAVGSTPAPTGIRLFPGRSFHQIERALPRWRRPASNPN
jgi:hypothetical protein